MTPLVRDGWRAGRNDGLAFVASLLAVVLVLGWLAGLPLEALRIPAGVFVGFFAPGYLLLRATVGPRVTGAVRFVLPVPLTLAMAAVVGIFVEQTRDGVRGDTLGITMCVLSLGLGGLAFIRGTHPVTLRARDMRPSLLDVLRGPFRPSVTASGPATPFAADLALSVAVVLALAVAGLWVSRSIDKVSGDTAGSVALTGRLQTVGPPRGGLVRTGVELTVENDRRTQTEGKLRIAIELAGEGTGRISQRLTIQPNSTARVLVPVQVPCDGAVRATLSNPSGARRLVRLRVGCEARG